MTLNSSRESIKSHRRLWVSRFRIQGLTVREIVDKLPSQTVNPETGAPWAVGTIHNDIKAVEAEWHAVATKEIGHHKSEVLATIDEVERIAWHEDDLNTVLKCQQQKRELLGLDMPQKRDITTDGQRIVFDVNLDRSQDTGKPSEAA